MPEDGSYDNLSGFSDIPIAKLIPESRTKFPTANLNNGIMNGLKGDSSPDIDWTTIDIDTKYLELEVLSSLMLEVGTKIIIGPRGLFEDGLNNPHVYFGSNESNNDFSAYKFGIEEIGIGKQHFIIRFNKKNKMYQIKNFNDGKGTFVKISKKTELKSGNIISIGEINFKITINESEMVIEFLSGSITKQIMYFIYII